MVPARRARRKRTHDMEKTDKMNDIICIEYHGAGFIESRQWKEGGKKVLTRSGSVIIHPLYDDCNDYGFDAPDMIYAECHAKDMMKGRRLLMKQIIKNQREIIKKRKQEVKDEQNNLDRFRGILICVEDGIQKVETEARCYIHWDGEKFVVEKQLMPINFTIKDWVNRNDWTAECLDTEWHILFCEAEIARGILSSKNAKGRDKLEAALKEAEEKLAEMKEKQRNS